MWLSFDALLPEYQIVIMKYMCICISNSQVLVGSSFYYYCPAENVT